MRLTRSSYVDVACVALIVLAGTAVFLTAPQEGNYWWSEAPRNALDGAFVLDLLRDMPLHHARDWAIDYYLQYPALTILFYPPVLHVALAGIYAVSGVSHTSAILAASLFFLALLVAAYALARRYAPPMAALSGALLLAACPELLRWGQQVMLDVPALALAAWAAFFLLRYTDGERPRDFAWFSVFAVLALYTKQTILFPLAGAGVGWLYCSGLAPLRRWHVWLTFGLCLIVLLPLGYMQFRFASFDATSVMDRPDLNLPARWSPAGFTWYAARFPEMYGWPLIVVAAIGVASGARTYARGTASVWFGWFVATYLVLSLIALKEPRHALPLALPLALAAAHGVAFVATGPRSGQIIAGAAAILAGAAFGFSLAAAPTPEVTGLHQAAEDIARLMPEGGRVMFAGNRDGSFIFNIRVLDPHRKIVVVRADKLFLRIVVQPGLGLHPRDFSRDEISAMLNEYGIAYVVTVPNVWSEAPVMANLAAVLASDQFEPLDHIPMTGPTAEKELVIYRNRGTLGAPPASLRSELSAGMAGGAAGQGTQ